jgi:hypothetical protein
VSLVQDYLKKGDVDHLCPAAHEQEFHETCEERITNETMKANLKALDILGEAEQGFAEKNSSKVALSFRTLGKYVLKNRFTVKNYIHWMKRTQYIRTSLLLEGENFKRVKIVN